MKKVLFLLVMVFAAMSASAQITWNAKAGLGVAHCWGDAEGLSSHFVGKIGAGIEKPLTSNWSLMPSFEIAWKGAEEKYEFESYDNSGYNYSGYNSYDNYGYNSYSPVNSTKETAKLDVLYLQIPILAAYRLNLTDDWNMTLKAGPYLGVGIYGRVHGAGSSYDLFGKEFNGKRFDFGLDFGLDFEYHRFVFGVEYELGFLPLLSQDGLDVKNAAFYATVGYKF